MNIAIVGATGLVGRKMIQVLEERAFPLSELIPVASDRSEGAEIEAFGKLLKVTTPINALEKGVDIALFSAGASVSEYWAPIFAEKGCRVIDNSSFWRMDSSVKLIVPEVNRSVLTKSDMIIANPNCSTIQMVTALNKLNETLKLKQIIVSTYQSVSGSGIKGIEQLSAEREERESLYEKAYKYKIDLNVIPQIDSFTHNGFTKEEMKMINETHKIFNDNSIRISPTTVRVPVMGGHSESVYAVFQNHFSMEQVFSILKNTPGVELIEEGEEISYPMPLYCSESDSVFIGRVRRDLYCKNALNMWIVADNLRKGAATNAVQIAELILTLH